MVSVSGQVADQLGLEPFAPALEEGDGLVAVPYLAVELFAAGHDVAHPFLDGRQVFQGERGVAG